MSNPVMPIILEDIGIANDAPASPGAGSGAPGNPGSPPDSPPSGGGHPPSVEDPNAYSAKAHYQDLFLRAMDGILLVDINTGNILEVNDAAMKVFRLPAQALNGTSLLQYTTDAFSVEFKKMIRIASRRYHPKSFEIPMIVGNPRVAIAGEIAMSPLKLSDGTEVLQCLVRDITEKKIAERKIADYIKQVEIANKKLEELATTDGMTGLTNFRQFSKLLDLEHSRAHRHGSKYAILFFDIDHFKKYNDQNGHPAGDALLKEFAKILKAQARTIDVVARYGGEEFVILCPETDTAQAGILAERTRAFVQATKFPFAEKQPMGFVSCCIGVASFPADGNDYKTVLKTADEVLYFSKHTGRNKVTLSQGLGKNPPIPAGSKK